MQIREAEDKDIPEIVGVLKASLGTDLPLSEEVWKYKHIENPFGRSIVLVAEEEEKIIGVRAFMSWKWFKGKKEYSALRAVDTATHPEHQGKGIFKKLTQKAIEVAKNNGDHFIFNTPNDKSRPGYLKMGWKPINRVKVGLKPSFSGFWRKNKKCGFKININNSRENLAGLCLSWNTQLQDSVSWYTPKTVQFLSWRYEKNPLQKYEVILDTKFYLAAYVKERQGIKELRLSELIYEKGNKLVQKEIKKKIKELEKKFGAQVVSFSPSLFDAGFLTLKGNYGPVLTFKNLNLSSSEEAESLSIEEWRSSLGDLELF